MVFRIAHQVVLAAGSRRPVEIIRPIRIPLKKMRMALCRILPFIPFPISHAGSCLADYRAMPPLTTAQRSSVRGEATARENSADSVDSV
jgi:hypothetical protein